MNIRVLGLACLLTPCVVMAGVPNNKIGYESLYNDANGVTHQAYCELDKLSFQNFSVGGAPELVSTDDMKTTRYVFNIMPVGWAGTWHKSPSAQWVIPVSGHWYIETMDHHRVKFGPGDLSFGYDIDAVQQDGKIGHISGTLGNEPAKVLVVQVNSLPKEIKDKRCMAGGTFIR